MAGSQKDKYLYITGPNFALKTGENEKKDINEFLELFFKGEKPETARAYMAAIHQHVRDLHAKLSAISPDAVNQLKTEVEKLREENRKLQQAVLEKNDAMLAAQTELQTLKLQATNDKPGELENDQRLFFLREYLPEGKTSMADAILGMKSAYDNTINKIIHDPLILLEKEEYDWLKNWDETVFIPNLEKIIGQELLDKYGIEDLKKELLARHKFMIILEAATKDPIEKIFELIPDMKPEVKNQLLAMQWPTQDIIIQVLNDINEKKTEPDVSTKPSLPVSETKTETEKTEEAKVIALKPGGGDGTGGDASGGNGGEGPE